MTTLRRALGIATLVLAACGGGGGSKVDEVAAAATAGCETATAALRAEGEAMLPGRACNNCHKKGGQSPDADTLWTVAGTVFGSATSMCNAGGLAGVKVEIFEGTSMTAKLTLTTNSAGNFYSTQAVTFPIRARISKDGKTQEMFGQMSNGNCASCHAQPATGGAPGRIFLN